MTRSPLIFILFLVCLVGKASAQIYADFVVSHGGSPLGTFRVRLDYDKAPRTCANFIGLATGQRAWLDTTTGVIRSGTPYYNGLRFHRLDHDFVIQGGDPRGNGSGGPGYVFQDEFNPLLRHSGRYILSMANSGANSNGSQFFITLEPASGLDDKHSVFGEVINDTTYPNSRTIITNFTNATLFPVNGETPTMDIVIDSVTISGDGLANFNIHDPAYRLPTVGGVNPQITYNPDTDQYRMTWDRKGQVEYYSAFSTDLINWGFVLNPYMFSLSAEDDWTYTLSGVSGDKFFSRLTAIDYSLTPRAPADLTANGHTFAIVISDTETVTLTFDGAGGGTWSHTDGSSGTISGVSWTRVAPPSVGVFFFPSSQAKDIPLGTLLVTFSSPVGSEGWHSFNLPTSFHTPFTGWTDGSAVIDDPDSDGTITVGKRVPFTYTP